MSQAQLQSASNMELALDQAAREREQADLALAQLRAQLNANTSKIASLAAELEATQKQLDNYAYNLPVVERQKLRADKRLNALRVHADRVAKELAAERRMQEYLEELQKDDEEGERRLKEYLGEVLSRETDGFSDTESDVSESWSVLSDSIPSKVPSRRVASLTSPVGEMKSVHEPRSTLGLSLETEDVNISGTVEPIIQDKPPASPPPVSLPQSPPTSESNTSLVPGVPSGSDQPLPLPSSFTPAILDDQSSSPQAPLPAETVPRTPSPSPTHRATPPIPDGEQSCPILQQSGPVPPSVVSQEPRHIGPMFSAQAGLGELSVAEALQEEQGPQDAGPELPASATTNSDGVQPATHLASLPDAQQPFGPSFRPTDHERPATPRVRASSLTSGVAPPRSPPRNPDVPQEMAPSTPHSPTPSGHIAVPAESVPRSNSETPSGSPQAEMSSQPPLSPNTTFATQPEAASVATSQSPIALAGSRPLPPSPQRQPPSMSADSDASEESSDEADLESETDDSERIEGSWDDAPAAQLQDEYDGQDGRRDDQEQQESDGDYDDEEEVTSEEEIAEQAVPEDVEEEDISDPTLHDGADDSSPTPSKVENPSPTVISASPPCPNTPPKQKLPITPSTPEARPDPSSRATKPSSPIQDPAVMAATTSKDAITNEDASKPGQPSTHEAAPLAAKPATLCSPPGPGTVHVYPPSRASNAVAHPPQRRDTPYHPKQLLSVFRNRYGSCANSNNSNNDGKLISTRNQDRSADNKSASPVNFAQRPVQIAYPAQASTSMPEACSQA